MITLRHRPLPCDDPTVLDNRSIISNIRSVSEHDLNAIAIQVKNSSIEVSILIASAGGRAIRSSSSIQSGGVEVSDGRSTRSGEGNVRCAGFYAMICQSRIYSTTDGIPTQAFLGTRRSRHLGFQSQFGCLAGQCSGILGAVEQIERTTSKLGDAKQ
jgi:hypothetical protein